MANQTQREQVFFSYSHKDKKWLELFQATLKPFIRTNQFSVWDDTKIKAGDIWRDEIKQALASAKVAVLLVSTNFLNSDFIAENELPPLLEAAQNEGLRILLVVVGHSLFEETELGRYQAVNEPSRPLASISATNREKEIVRICKEIKSAALGTIRASNAEENSKPSYITPDSVEGRAVLSPRNTIKKEWDKVESLIVQAGRRNGLVDKEERVVCGHLINKLHEAGKISNDIREKFFNLSKWHSSVAFNSFSSPEPAEAITFTILAEELQQELNGLMNSN
ncbi:MAG TPA: toll/interleukin-1 receptor domain-containing protein [Pyrinomonadaceae bacterium]